MAALAETDRSRIRRRRTDTSRLIHHHRPTPRCETQPRPHMRPNHPERPVTYPPHMTVPAARRHDLLPMPVRPLNDRHHPAIVGGHAPSRSASPAPSGQPIPTTPSSPFASSRRFVLRGDSEVLHLRGEL